MNESDLLKIQYEAFKMLPPDWLSYVPKCDGHVYYRFLYLIASALKPKLSVELGTFGGTGAWSLWNGNKDGRVVSIDVDCRFISDFCYASGIEYRCHDSLSVDRDLVPIDLLFIDTVHNGDRPYSEYMAWKGNLSSEGIVLFDDIWMNPKMEEMWKSLPGNKFEMLVHDSYGFGVLLG